MDLKQHWNKAYTKSEVENLGWYESDPNPSLELINNLNLPKNARIFNPGAGASTLIDSLLDEGFANIIANDISESALEKLKLRLGDQAAKVDWIVDDLVQPTHLQDIDAVDVWHDRAVLHFFTDEVDRRSYFNLLKQLVNPGGYVIIAAFHLEGAEKCSGLPVYRYNKNMIVDHLGEAFTLVKDFEHTYIQPSGNSRKYVYTLFFRQKK